MNVNNQFSFFTAFEEPPKRDEEEVDFHPLPSFNEEPQPPLPSFNVEPQPPLPSFNEEPQPPLPSFNVEPQPPLPSFNEEPQPPLSSFKEEAQPPLPSFKEKPQPPLPSFNEEPQPPLPVPAEEEPFLSSSPAFEASQPVAPPPEGTPIAPDLIHVFHPIMSQFTTLAKRKTYEEIVDEALRFGTLGDLRMLKNYSALKTKYLHTLFDHLIADIPFLLPKSFDYTPSMENSEEQFKEWEKFINGLISVACIEELAVFLPALQVKRLLEPRPYPASIDREQTLGLLRFKDFVHSFFCEILKQEKRNLKNFEQAVAKLRTHIQEEFHALRVQQIQSFAALDFSQHEVREPPRPVNSNPSSTVEHVDENQMKQDLIAIQQAKPKAYQLRNFTNHALSFTDPNVKGKYLIELANVYAKLQTFAALKMAVTWIDQALLTVTDQTVKLKCHEIRGALRLQINEVKKRAGLREKGTLRKGIDLSYRDFHKSIELESPVNYVRNFKHDLLGSLKTDSDYAEAHYAHFLKKFEQLELSTPRMLPSHFRNLKSYFLKKSGKKEGEQFKVTLTTGTAWVKFEENALYIHSTDPDALHQLLTSGIKKVHAVEEKVYFGQKVTLEQFRQMVKALDDTPKRLAQIEECLEAFRSFELSAFYKTSLGNREQNREAVLSRLDRDLLLALVRLHEMAVRGYSLLRTPEDAAAALAHTAQGVSLCDRLLTLYPKDAVLKEKKLNFLLKKGALYNQLELIQNAAEAWEQVLLYAKQENPHFFNPSLHFNLACAYQRLNRPEEAKEQLFSLINSPWTDKSWKKNAEKKLQKELKKRKGVEQDRIKLMDRFKERNILDDCLQILRAHHKANSLTHKTVPIWETFIQQINQTTTLREFFEVLFSSIHVSKEHMLLLAQVSNSRIGLDQIKSYVHDAVAAYKEIEAREEDIYLEELAKVKQKGKEVKAFFDMKQALQKELKKGENIRSGSQIRLKMETLNAQLSCQDVNVLEQLQSCFNTPDFNNPDLVKYCANKENAVFLTQELSSLIEEALDSSYVSLIEKDVLRITGRNIFLHEILEEVKKATIHEVHIIGVNVYIDTSFSWNGINLAIGGKFVEFLQDQNGAKLKIDLSGSKGEDGEEVSSEPAPKGATPGQAGGKGEDGIDAKGGFKGGDFLIKSDELAGAECVEMIYLNGGAGGKGSNGQPGGTGADGVEGKDAPTHINEYYDQYCDCFVDFRQGTPGTPGGDGGKGGNEGAGGQGGDPGRFLIANKEIPYEAEPGDDGGNGTAGKGGEPGKGGALGLSLVRTRDTQRFAFFKISSKNKEKSDIGLDYPGWKNDPNPFDADKWQGDGRTKDQTRVNGKRQRDGKTVAQQGKTKHVQKKNKLQEQLFTTNLASHLSKESAENRALAFDAVTNQLAQVKDTEEILKEQCAEKKKKLKDIDNLQEMAKTVLNQTQNEKRAQTETIRMAAFSSGKKVGSNAAQEIAYFLKHPEKDQKNLLPFHLYPAAVHKALYAVNVSKGKNMHALAALVEEMGELDEPLFEKLKEIVKSLSLKDALDGFDRLMEVVFMLKGKVSFKAAVFVQHARVKELKEKIQKEKEALEKAYESECKTLMMQIGIHQFLLRDHLFHKGFSPTSKERRWFEARLAHKVNGFALQVGIKPDPFYAYAQKVLNSPEHLAQEKKRLQMRYKTLRRDKEWMVEHLSDLIIQEISIQGVNIDKLYEECSKKWAALPHNFVTQIKVAHPTQPERPAQEEEDVLETATWEEVYALRKSVSDKQLSSYFEMRHIELIGKKCADALLKPNSPHKKTMEELLRPFLQKVNTLYRFHPFVSYDFLAIALKVVEENQELTFECLEKNSFHALEEKIINQAVDGPPAGRKTDQLIHFFSISTIEQNLNACLFLLLNQNLKYAELVQVVEIAKKKKLSKEAWDLINQKAEGEKSKFDQQWEAVFERGKAFDQLLQKGEGSVELLLRHIAIATTLLQNDEKIALLDQIIEIVSKKGPYTSLRALKALIAKLGAIPHADEYNRGLEALIVRGEKVDLAPLWMKSEISEALLQKAIVAVNHIPFNGKELIALYKKAYPLKNNEILLSQIKPLLCIRLSEEANKIIQEAVPQKGVLEEFSDLVRGTQILHPEQQIAKFSLWISLGNEGRAALKVFKEKFRTSTAEEALKAFDAHLALKRKDLAALNQLIDRIAASDQVKLNCWITYLNAHFAIKGEERAFYKQALDVFQTSEGRDDFNRWMNKKYTGAINDDEIVRQLEKKDAAAEELENNYWLGLIPFSPEKEETSILKLLEGKEVSIATRKLFKRKFDLFMVHDDCNQMREKAQAAKKKEHEELKEWVGSVQNWLLTQKITPHELEKHTKWKAPLPQRAPLEKKMDHAMVRKFLAQLDPKAINDEDSQTLYLIKESMPEFKEECAALELKLIATKDQQEKEKEEAIQKFLGALPFETKEDHALQACFTMMGQERFLPLLTHLTRHAKQIEKEMLDQLLWVVPRLKNPLDVIENRRPEMWAAALLEHHCLELLKPSVQAKFLKFSDLKLKNKQEEDKDRLIREELNKKEKECKEFVKKFQSSLKALIEAEGIGLREKELLLRLFAERLALKNEKEMDFSIEEFASLIGPDYLLAEGVVKNLFQSSLSGHLAQPLFQTFKHVITYAWIETMLAKEPHEQRLIEGLFTIDTVRKERAMRSVVEALRGNFLTASVSDAVAHFADKSWELDEESLQILKNRKEDGAWYAKIEEHTREKRSKERVLQTLVDIMAEEKEGINLSLKELLGEDPKLVKDIEEIKKYAEEVKGWTKEKVTEWAITHRAPTFLDDEKRLKKGIALISRANKLIGSYTLYDTQFIALWLMLRKKTENRGRIAQMFTGEGKSITFAGLAILRAMACTSVDVITTSYVLAERDAEERAPLFELFNLTVSNNCDLACEADEELRKKRYYDHKPIDIVYGDVSCFERDLLLTEFHGKEIIHPERLALSRSALVDEVDGLFLDNAGMVLYLTHNVDTLRFVSRIFEEIWVLANQTNGQDDRVVEAIIKVVQGKIEAKKLLLPSYQVENARYIEMKEIIQRKLPLWIRSALLAKKLKVDKEYIVTEQVIGGKKKKSVTVMDIGTGVEQFALKWSNGLHQFLQLKHALDLGDEGLKAVFLSNFFFFKRYGANLFGLSGTLGSAIEQSYLEELYKADLCKIPRAKEEKYIQRKAQVAGSWEEWVERINDSIDKQIKDHKRAVLVICESVEEVYYLQKHLKEQYPAHHIYTSSLQKLPFLDPKDPALVRPGDLIIATNLAGRGTDLKTHSHLEANRGLHVILSYLPRNIRIQDQAFGRTARSGNEGSGEFIIMDPDCRTISELGATRDLEEKKRLESIATKEVRKIEFEQDLLRGFEGVEGFESVLRRIQGELQNELPIYQKAQLDSLKNRWAFWLDHMEEKISLVYTLGREGVIASYKQFIEGVRRDYQAGGFRLIKEPAELIKLGGEYRREKMWTRAEECYREAAKDPHYDYARYYMGFCSYAQHPDPAFLKKQVKKAERSIKNEIKDLQGNMQNIVDLAEKRRRNFGELTYGLPYKQRMEEKMQVWSIFLSSIDSAIGGSLTGDKLKPSPFIKDEEEGAKILESLGDNYKKGRLSKKWDPAKLPDRFKPALEKLKADPDRSIDKQKLKEYCRDLFTQEMALKHFVKPQTVYKFSPLPPSFKGWPKEENVYTEQVKFVLSEFVELLGNDPFEKHEEMIVKLQEMQKEHTLLKNVDMRRFFKLLLQEQMIAKDYKIDVTPFVKKGVKFTAYPKTKEGFTEAYQKLPLELQDALVSACPEKNGDEWSFTDTLYLSDLNLPKTTTDASEMLWMMLLENQMIKPGKFKAPASGLELKMQEVKEKVKSYFSGLGKIDDDLKHGVDSIFEVIDGSIGMIHKLQDKKSTAEFAAIMRKCYQDHYSYVPEGLNFFIDLGLEAIADLVEKKDPPAWYEIVSVIAMGVIQMVAGVIIKAFVPVVGELISSALINTGMDDVMFAISSAVSGEFSWDDYAKHKVESLKNAVISSAIGAGISFGVNAAELGSIEKAYTDVQQLSDVEKLAKASKMTDVAFSQSFNLGSYIGKEIGNKFFDMGVSQVASRGLEGMTKIISSSYESGIKSGIESAVNSYWPHVLAQADALFEKSGGDSTVIETVKECVKIAMKILREEKGIEGMVRESKPYIQQASGVIADKGWSQFFSYASDIAKLGITIPKLTHLVDDNARALMRLIRTKVEIQAEKPAGNADKTEFHKELADLKREYTKQLIEAFNQTLTSAVFAPLVSMGTTALVQAGKEALFPETEQEQIAKSAKTLSDIAESERNPEKAFYDEPLRKWRGATNEVKDLTEKELEATPVNGGGKIKALKLQYGSLLKVYKDGSGNFYVQRPTRAEYIRGIREGKASGDPELFALAKVVGKNIVLKTPDGVVKTFSPDKKVSDTIYLELERNSETGIGHVVGATKSTGNDCLYEVVNQKAGVNETIESLRDKTATKLEESGKQFYHEWSLQSGEKEFMGRGMKAVYEIAWERLKSLSIDKVGDVVKTLGEKGEVLWYVGGQTMGGISEYAAALALVPLTSGTAAILSGVLITDGSDRLSAAYLSLAKMKKVDTLFSKSLQSAFHLSPEKADWYHDMFTMVIDVGPILMREGRYIVTDLRALASTKKEEIKLLLKDVKNGMSAGRVAQKGAVLALPMLSGEYRTLQNQSVSGQHQLEDIIAPAQRRFTHKDDGSFSIIEPQNRTMK